METSEFWKNHNYELVLTEDQSPTLRWLGAETQETMHHRGGAYSETQLIYGEPLRECLEGGGRRVLSVGLGLGYNEILTALEALKRQIPAKSFHLLSFESEDFLKNHFLSWVRSSQTDMVYDEILHYFTDSSDSVKDWLHEAYQLGAWRIEGALTPDFQMKDRWECLFYDAFSSKTSPYLWQEDFLTEFFARACAAKCWVSTYACTGALKRALKKNDFEVRIRDGFQSKRNSTLGFRFLSSAL